MIKSLRQASSSSSAIIISSVIDFANKSLFLSVISVKYVISSILLKITVG